MLRPIFQPVRIESEEPRFGELLRQLAAADSVLISHDFTTFESLRDEYHPRPVCQWMGQSGKKRARGSPLGSNLAVLGLSTSQLGPNLGLTQASWLQLGPNCAPMWRNLGRFEHKLGLTCATWACVGPRQANLGRNWFLIGGMLEPSWAEVGVLAKVDPKWRPCCSNVGSKQRIWTVLGRDAKGASYHSENVAGRYRSILKIPPSPEAAPLLN